MKQYQDLTIDTLAHGDYKKSRPGVDTIARFGGQYRFDLSEGFPMVTTKKIHLKSIIHELLWFIKGDTNIHYLQENGVRIWNEWANEDGDLGPVYGHQWRNWNSENIDQLTDVIESIKKNPDSRRLLVSAWNPGVLPDTSISFEENIANGKAALPPCHAFFQFYVANDKLSCQLYQRSADIFLGVPFNIASYALLTMMAAQVTGYEVGDFIHTFGDQHIYVAGTPETAAQVREKKDYLQKELQTILQLPSVQEQRKEYQRLKSELEREIDFSNDKRSHLIQSLEQASREPRRLPKMKLNPKKKNIEDFVFEDFTLEDYDPHPHISGAVAK